MALTDQMAAYWGLEETAGTRYDLVGTNHLTDNNTVTSNPGKLATAAQFTAANSEWLSIADNAALSIGGAVSFTIVAWVYLDTKPSQAYLVSKFDGTAAGCEYLLYYALGADRFQFLAGNGTNLYSATANTFGVPATGTWYFLVAWYDTAAATVNICVNDGGVDSASFAVGTPVDTTAAVNIGRGGVASPQYHDGRIDEVGIWKRVLTAAERTQLYNSGAGLAPLWWISLVAWWKLDEPSGTRFDSYGTNHLTDVNTVTSNPGKQAIAAQITSANSERLKVADNAALSLGGGASITIAAWVYFDSLTGFIVAKHDGVTAPGSEYVLYYDGSRFQFRLYNTVAGSDGMQTSSALAISTWYFVVAWYDHTAGPTIYIQQDNGTVNSKVFLGTINDTTTAFDLGASDNGGNLFNGRLDEVAVWKRILTASERSALYNGGAGTTYSVDVPRQLRPVRQAVARRAVR